jgi:hypothetical protein
MPKQISRSCPEGEHGSIWLFQGFVVSEIMFCLDNELFDPAVALVFSIRQSFTTCEMLLARTIVILDESCKG